MNWKKICVTATLSVVLLISSCSTVLAFREYPDVDYDTAQGQAIMDLSEAGVVGGYEDGTFRPNGQLTRAEFVKIINGVFRYKAIEDGFLPFDDVSGHWAEYEIRIAQQNGYIGGVGAIQGVGERCFAPNSTLTREQVAVILSRILNLENVFQMNIVFKDAVSDWARADVEKAIVCGIFQLEANNTFRATAPITRAEVCEVLAPYVQKDYLVAQMNQKQIQSALQEAVMALPDLTYEDSTRNQIIDNLVTCMTAVLEDSWNETEISREYVESAYGQEISQTRKLYSSLPSGDRKALRSDIINSMSLDALAVLYDYFLDEKDTDKKE